MGTVVIAVLAGCRSAPERVERITEIPVPAPAVPAPAVPVSPTSALPNRRPELPPHLTAAPAPAPSTNGVVDEWIAWARWCSANGLGAPRHLAPPDGGRYDVQTPGGTLEIRLGSRVAVWDGLEVWLGFAPQRIDGQPYVHALDAQKSFQPLLSDTNALAGASPVVVIDPGHGGENTGARSVLGNHFEKEYTLDWARRLHALLVTNGWTVVLTRTNDIDLSLSNRVALADQVKADLFVSLHFNSGFPNEKQAGLETYCLTPTGMPSSLTRDFLDDVREVFPNNAFDARNLQLAARLQRALVAATGEADRGVRRARFMGVLRGQHRPAVLIEGGYLSNPRDARLIATTRYRQELAEAVFRGLQANDASRLVATHGPSPAATARP